MKQTIALFTVVACLALGPVHSLQADQVGKEALSVDEITELAAEERADQPELAETTGGEEDYMRGGAGILILVCIATGVLIAVN